MTSIAIAPASATRTLGSSSTFANPLYRGADPWVTRHGEAYYLCMATRTGRIDVCRSDTLIRPGDRSAVWSPPARGWNRAQVWAPELHRIGDRWYIYYAASNGLNANHRMGVLESAEDDPQGRFVDRGQLDTGGRWAIDGTVLELRGQLYFLWSGWEGAEDVQHLYVARMSDACTVSSARVRICANDDYLWERVGETRRGRGLNEGPQVLKRNGRVFLVYSCSGSWQASYKLGMLVMEEGADPMEPGSWVKCERPAFESAGEIFGVGHCSFMTSPDGTEDWMLYHSKVSRREGWDRVVRAQRFTWDDRGYPHFGSPVHGPLELPSGHARAVEV